MAIEEDEGLTVLDATSIAEGARIANFLPYIEDAIYKQIGAAERRVFSLLDSGKLTPEVALYAWQERRIALKMLSQWKQKVRIGQTVGARQTLNMEGNYGS